MPNVFQQGDWGKSLELGMNMRKQMDNEKLLQEQAQQRQAEFNMKMEEFKLKLQEQKRLREDAEATRTSFKEMTTPKESETITDSGFGYDQNSQAPYTTIPGKAPIDEMLGVRVSPMLRAFDQKTGGELLKNIIAKRFAQDNSVTESEIAMMPDTDPRKIAALNFYKQKNTDSSKPFPSSIQDEAYRLVKQEFAKDGVNREPYASEVSEMVTALTNNRKTAEYQAMKDVKGSEGFNTWSPQAKNEAFMFHAITGKPPVSAQGMGSNDRQAYGKGYQQWIVDKGLKASDVALMQADYKAGDMSLRNMTKQEAPMNAFVMNIGKQIDKVKELYNNKDRIGLRLLDVPLRDLKVKASGSGDEAVKASYLLEISNEIGKLSSGASASIAQLSDSAKEDWKKVHDVNLSLKDILKVVNATKEQADMRISTWREARKAVRDELRAIGTPEQETPKKETTQQSKPMRNLTVAVAHLKQAKNRDDALQRAKKLIAQGWTPQEIDAAGDQAGW